MKTLSSILSLVLLVVYSILTPLAIAEEPSLGTKSGEAARDFRIKAEESYKNVSEETQRASEEIKETAQDAYVKFREQMQETYEKFKEKADVVIQKLQHEWQKFNEAYHKPAAT